MAENKTEKKSDKKTEKKSEKGFFAKVGLAIWGFFCRIGKAFANMWRELKKTTWPTKDKLIRYSCIVVLFIIFMMVVIGLLDKGASALITWMATL